MPRPRASSLTQYLPPLPWTAKASDEPPTPGPSKTRLKVPKFLGSHSRPPSSKRPRANSDAHHTFGLTRSASLSSLRPRKAPAARPPIIHKNQNGLILFGEDGATPTTISASMLHPAAAPVDVTPPLRRSASDNTATRRVDAHAPSRVEWQAQQVAQPPQWQDPRQAERPREPPRRPQYSPPVLRRVQSELTTASIYSQATVPSRASRPPPDVPVDGPYSDTESVADSQVTIRGRLSPGPLKAEIESPTGERLRIQVEDDSDTETRSVAAFTNVTNGDLFDYLLDVAGAPQQPMNVEAPAPRSLGPPEDEECALAHQVSAPEEAHYVHPTYFPVDANVQRRGALRCTSFQDLKATQPLSFSRGNRSRRPSVDHVDQPPRLHDLPVRDVPQAKARPTQDAAAQHHSFVAEQGIISSSVPSTKTSPPPDVPPTPGPAKSFTVPSQAPVSRNVAPQEAKASLRSAKPVSSSGSRRPSVSNGAAQTGVAPPVCVAPPKRPEPCSREPSSEKVAQGSSRTSSRGVRSSEEAARPTTKNMENGNARPPCPEPKTPTMLRRPLNLSRPSTPEHRHDEFSGKPRLVDTLRQKRSRQPQDVDAGPDKSARSSHTLLAQGTTQDTSSRDSHPPSRHAGAVGVPHSGSHNTSASRPRSGSAAHKPEAKAPASRPASRQDRPSSSGRPQRNTRTTPTHHPQAPSSAPPARPTFSPFAPMPGNRTTEVSQMTVNTPSVTASLTMQHIPPPVSAMGTHGEKNPPKVSTSWYTRSQEAVPPRPQPSPRASAADTRHRSGPKSKSSTSSLTLVNDCYDSKSSTPTAPEKPRKRAVADVDSSIGPKHTSRPPTDPYKYKESPLGHTSRPTSQYKDGTAATSKSSSRLGVKLSKLPALNPQPAPSPSPRQSSNHPTLSTHRTRRDTVFSDASWDIVGRYADDKSLPATPINGNFAASLSRASSVRSTATSSTVHGLDMRYWSGAQNVGKPSESLSMRQVKEKRVTVEFFTAADYSKGML